MYPDARTEDAKDPIVDAIRAGRTREAIALSVAEHGAALGRFCMAMLGNQAEADEITQETFLAAFSAFATYREEASVRGFLYGIARHLCATKLAKRTRRERRLSLVHDAAAPPESPPDFLERRARAPDACRARRAPPD
jgi:RNA polymerase sigma-70 factor (ECF subfamily)